MSVSSLYFWKERKKKSEVVAIVLLIGLWIMCASSETMEGKLNNQLVKGEAQTFLMQNNFLCCTQFMGITETHHFEN